MAIRSHTLIFFLLEYDMIDVYVIAFLCYIPLRLVVNS